jgi:hypothetical protein
MPLHRDIHWIGRQWAVTGHGMQLIDQKLQGFFDVEVERLWDDSLIESIHAKEWLNRADFDKGLALARARYPKPSGAVTPPRQFAPPPAIEPAAPPPVVKPIAPKPETPKLEIPKPATPTPAPPAPVEPPRAVGESKASVIAARAAVEPSAAVTPPRQAAPPPPVVPDSPRPPVVKREEPKPVAPTIIKPATVEPPAPAIATPMPVEPSKPPASLFAMRYEGRAKFVRPWRVVVKRQT